MIRARTTRPVYAFSRTVQSCYPVLSQPTQPVLWTNVAWQYHSADYVDRSAYLDLEVTKDEEGAVYTGDPWLLALYTCTVELAELYTGDTASVSADAGAARSDDLNIKSELLCLESQDYASIDNFNWEAKHRFSNLKVFTFDIEIKRSSLIISTKKFWSQWISKFKNLLIPCVLKKFSQR